jgi:hypothetical protein
VHGNDVAKNRFFEIDKDTRRKVDFFNWSLWLFFSRKRHLQLKVV